MIALGKRPPFFTIAWEGMVMLSFFNREIVSVFLIKLKGLQCIKRSMDISNATIKIILELVIKTKF